MSITMLLFDRRPISSTSKYCHIGLLASYFLILAYSRVSAFKPTSRGDAASANPPLSTFLFNGRSGTMRLDHRRNPTTM